MANDGGMVARLEAAVVERLKTLQNEGVDVFKTVDHWRHQIGIGNSGIASFERFAPFAFVKWRPESPQREGDYDLNQKLTIAVAIGQINTQDGDARIGSADKIGISLMHSLVVNLLDGWRGFHLRRFSL